MQNILSVGTLQDLRSRLIGYQNVLYAVLISLVVILGTVLRFYDLGAEGYWIDELIMLRVAGGSLESLVESARGARPPVYVVSAHFWIQAFGTSEFATRSLSAVAASLALVVMYMVGSELFDRRVGLISTVLLAISEYQIGHAQDFRYYSLFLLITLLSFFFYIRALRTGKWYYFTLYILTGILTFYTHTYGAFTLFAQGVFFLLQWKRYRSVWIAWVVSEVVIVMLTAPGLFMATNEAVEGTTGVQTWIPERPLWYPLETLQVFVFSERFYLNPLAKRSLAAMGFLTIGLALFVFWKGRTQWFSAVRTLLPESWQGASRRSSELLLVTLWLAGPIVIPMIVSALTHPMFAHRYAIGAAPAFYLIIAVVFVAIGKVIPPVLPVGMLVLLIGPALREYYVNDYKEQWREMAAYVAENVQPGDVIVFAPDNKGLLQEFFFIYYQDDLPACSLQQPETIAELEPAIARCTSGHNRFWLMLRGNAKRSQVLRAFFEENPPDNLQLVQERQFLGGISIHLFTWRE